MAFVVKPRRQLAPTVGLAAALDGVWNIKHASACAWNFFLSFFLSSLFF
jgi:hypothetical protein